ncbi:MAG TPA: nucleotidyltransferase domain-containing protein [Bdellovibrionota bacterium]|nr:nucleotidyltransferase domain-containing protein [Bdellovibrionota bacterium]
MKLNKNQLKIIDNICRKSRLDFVRVFGSAATSKKPRDIDLAIGTKPLTLALNSRFIAAMEKVFKKDIDVVHLKPGLSPTLVLEIAKNSKPIWEKEDVGRSRYADLIDRLVAIAQDERLSFPKELRIESAKRVHRRLRVT